MFINTYIIFTILCKHSYIGRGWEVSEYKKYPNYPKHVADLKSYHENHPYHITKVTKANPSLHKRHAIENTWSIKANNSTVDKSTVLLFISCYTV